MYGISKNNFKYNIQYVYSGYDENYTGFISNIEEVPNNWIVDDIRKVICRENGIDPEKVTQPYRKLKEKLGEDLYLKKLEDFALKNAKSVFRLTAIGDDAGKDTIEIRNMSKKNKDKVFEVKRENNSTRFLLNGQEIAFYYKKIKNIDGVDIPTMLLSNIWTDISWEGIASEGGVKLKKGKKPEKLLKRIIEMSTSIGDIVLDYHLGSGTTVAVAHKLNRRYIGIEQLDYNENDSVVRIKNVIKNDFSGISSLVNWKGGGDFVYCELAKWNEEAKEKIINSKSLKELKSLFNELYTKYFLNYNVNIIKFKEIIEEENFNKLSLNRQKEMFLRILDLNQMYVNLNEMEDEKYGISKEDIELTRKFYGMRG